MFDVTQSVPVSLIAETVGTVFVVIAIGIMMVKSAKQKKGSLPK
jgi:hypothetical protein